LKNKYITDFCCGERGIISNDPQKEFSASIAMLEAIASGPFLFHFNLQTSFELP
jgi:hypothetical protein